MRLVPVVCDVSVTNVCNATCDFCSFAHDKGNVRERRWIDRRALARALPILRGRGVRYLNFQGGEPLLHKEIDGLVADTAKAGIRPGLITNGWLLPKKIDALLDAGLRMLLISIDSHSIEEHERNRGLRGLGDRIREGLAHARARGVPAYASVTVNRLVHYAELPGLLDSLGFDSVIFSYPRRLPFGSSSLVYGETSPLIDFKAKELVDSLSEIDSLRGRFHVMNPRPSIEDVQRHLLGEEELFACVGGHKYFYLDWNLDVWRCEAWSEPLGSVFDFTDIPDQRDRCNACTMACYRDNSVMMHVGVALEDAASAVAAGRFREAAQSLWRRSVVESLRSVANAAHEIVRLTPWLGRRARRARGAAAVPSADALSPGCEPAPA